MCITNTEEALTVCSFNVGELRVHVEPAFVLLRGLCLRSGLPQAR